MILVDAGVLIDFLRTKDRKLNQLFRSLPVAVCGVTRAEILAGARGARNRQNLRRFLDRFQQVGITERLWDLIGDTVAALASRGLTVPFPDAVIATVGVEIDAEVWARDLHFPMMQRILPRLKLFQEPP